MREIARPGSGGIRKSVSHVPGTEHGAAIFRLAFIWASLAVATFRFRVIQRLSAGAELHCAGGIRIAPLYTRWTQEFGKRDANIQIRYLPIGTSEGIKEISRGASDFGAGEAPLTAMQRKDGSLDELPVVLIGIVLTYSLPDSWGAAAFRRRVG
ncbi:MAG TPA: hypothetical protein VN902_16960 [Candidatus Acidoferrales bacterium]|nr:hypothetical protein [Candidatus Acidoferrales bacterium]